MKYLLTMMLIASVYSPMAWANDVVVCDPTHSLVPNAVSRFETKVAFPETPGYLVWIAPNNTMSTEKQTAMSTLRAQIDSLMGIPTRYWICKDVSPTDGVLDSVGEMTQAQKDAINAPEVADQQVQVSYDTEITTNDLCTATLDEIVTRISAEKATIDTNITNATNIVGLRTAMLDANTRYAAAFRKVAKCLRARAR